MWCYAVKKRVSPIPSSNFSTGFGFRNLPMLLVSMMFLAVSSALAANYTATVDYDGTLYYKVVTDNGTQSQSCRTAANGVSYSSTSLNNRNFQFFTDKKCNKSNQIVSIKGSELFPEETTASIAIASDGSWEFKAPEENPDPESSSSAGPAKPESSSSSAGKPGQSSSSSSISKRNKKTINFLAPWSNTNAILFMDGDSVAIMTSIKNYCGWFSTSVTMADSTLRVYFKQTIGANYVGAEGMVIDEPTIASEIVLDSIAALTDTIWVQGYKNDAPAVFSKYPGVLGECPLKKFPVTVFDWLHGKDGDGGNPGQNGDPANGISSNFGSGGCNSVRGMVKYELGSNGVPVPSDPFPSKCLRSDHLAEWFLPEVVGKDAQGTEYTNMTCRDLYISMDNEGFWLAEVSKDRISVGNEKNKGGMFLLDDFEFLDEAKTVKNPYFDWLNGSGGNHNFGFTVKIQAQFEYVPGQYFDFYGDDDVWVFIDNRLAVDIGGQHGQEAGAVLLDTIGQNNGKKLVPGETYDFHIFYVERHVSESNFRMRTSIDLQVDASIFVDSDKRGSITNYNVWQINKKNKLSCGYDPNNTEVDTTGGPSTFKLIGGNLAEPEILGIGKHYEGINITSDSTFSIDSAAIVDNIALAPGHYFIEITLKSDPSQTTKIEIIIPSYAIPSIAFADSSWKILGKEISGDTLQIGDWAYATYPVRITFFEEWAQVSNYNRKISLSSSNPLLEIQDANGNRIDKVTLDSNGQAMFYVHANGEVLDAVLTAKGAAATASFWKNLNFALPPIPRIASASMHDRNGDGRADSLFIHFDKKLDSKNILDSLQFTFGESFPIYGSDSYKILANETDIAVTTEGACEKDSRCGFGSRQFTGGESAVYEGSVNTWFTYKGDGKSTQFSTEADPISDKMGPIVVKAVKATKGDGNRELTLTFSEAIDDETRENYTEMFEFICNRAGVNETPTKPVQQSGSGNSMILIYSVHTQDVILPTNGDLIRFVSGKDNVAKDLLGNTPHKDNPWATITGDQDISNESPGVIAVGEDPFNIISNVKETTQPNLITNTTQTAQQIGDSLGVQGNLIDYDISKIMIEQTQKDVDALDNFITSKLGSTTTYDTSITVMTEEEAITLLFADISAGVVGEAYGISEEVVIAIQEGTITIDNYKSKVPDSVKTAITKLVETNIEESRDTTITVAEISTVTQTDLFNSIKNGELDKELKDAGISEALIEAIKNGDIDEYNIEEYRNGSKSIVADSAVVLYYQTRYYGQMGEYVGGDKGSIKCSDATVFGDGGCMNNKGRLFLAWNMRSDNGRLVGTGVYIARLQLTIKVNGKTTLDQTRDKMWGVRRGQFKGIEF